MQGSAMSFQTKKSSLTGDLNWRITNTEHSMLQSINNKILCDFVCKFQNSSYSKTNIVKMFTSGLRSQNEKGESAMKGGNPFHRDTMLNRYQN